MERDRLRWESIAELTGTEPVFVSPVTLAELKFGAERAKDPDVRSRRLAGVEAILRKPILPIDGTTGIIFGDLSARLHTSGRDRKFRLHDLIDRCPGSAARVDSAHAQSERFYRHSGRTASRTEVRGLTCAFQKRSRAHAATRVYRSCNPPNTGRATMLPTSGESVARGIGGSLFSERWFCEP